MYVFDGLNSLTVELHRSGSLRVSLATTTDLYCILFTIVIKTLVIKMLLLDWLQSVTGHPSTILPGFDDSLLIHLLSWKERGTLIVSCLGTYHCKLGKAPLHLPQGFLQ